MKKTIYLHIGSGKTGTTSIQNMLNQNKKSLLDHGYFYHPTNPIIKRPNHHDLVSTPFNNSSWERDKSKYLVLKELFLNSSAPVMIISTEKMMGVPQYYIKNIQSIFTGIDIKIIAYVRNQVDAMPSYFLQRQKDNESDYKKNLNNFFHHYKNNFGNEIQKLLDNWLPVFGKENMIMCVYDRDILFEKDICQDFSHALGISSAINHIKYDANESLLPELSSLVTTIDTLLPALRRSKSKYRQKNIILPLLQISTFYKSGNKEYDHIFDLLAKTIHQNFKHIKTKALYQVFIAIEKSRKGLKQNTKINLLTTELKEEILNYYKNNNQRFAKTFLNSEETECFLKYYNKHSGI